MVNFGSKKLEDLLKFGIGILLIINFNIFFSKSTVRFDLTEEKRFTISDATIELLKSLNDVVYVDVYLEGDFPPGFQRLQKAVRQTLDDFRVYAGDNVQYRFINPDDFQGQEGKQNLIQSLGEKGIQPTNLFANEDGKRTERLIFPGAVISFAGSEEGVMLLKGNKSSPPQDRLNQSIEGIEYELASTINRLVNIDRKRVGLIKGHGELDSLDIYAIRNELLKKYDVFDVDLRKKKELSGYDAIILAKPRLFFSEKDLYKLDQFIMNGGKAIMLLDMLDVNLDSINSEGTIGFPLKINLDNLLFKYGVRINKDYLLDLSSGGFPVVVGNMGNDPQVQMMPWPFYPIVNQFSDHPIVRNLDAVYMKFTSSIDTVRSDNVKKTPLMFSSAYTKTVTSPVRISLNDLRKEMSPEIFNQGSKPLAYLLEGNFTSVFKNRFIPEGFEKTRFKDQSPKTAIIICADGDLFKNEINPKTNVPFELGYDPYLQAEFANKDFIINGLSYLIDENNLILTRNKEILIRPLDKIKAEEQKLKWQIINLLIPILIIILYGFLRHYHRKRKYSTKF
jgi:gliding-associated putative ABC transporter substrate-binding component GldG